VRADLETAAREARGIRQNGRVPGRIVVGIDGSEHAAAALRWAADEASLRGATLVAVHQRRSVLVCDPRSGLRKRLKLVRQRGGVMPEAPARFDDKPKKSED